MTRKSQLETVDEVIAAFGGVTAMSAIFGGFPSRFSNYKAAGRFPDIADELLGGDEEESQRELPLMAAE
jgi:hypothetical protein